jgi:Family of unknown function (DUF6869)
MSEEKRWRILIDGDGAATEPLTAEDIVTRLWSSPDDLLLWAEPLQPGEACFPQDVPEVRRLLLEDPSRVVHAFMKHRGHAAPDWPFLWVVENCQQDPAAGWVLLRVLLEASESDEDLAVVAAGPLEEMLIAQGAAVIDELEAEASRSPRFRRLLSGVWRSTIEENVWQRVQAARAGDPGIDDD